MQIINIKDLSDEGRRVVLDIIRNNKPDIYKIKVENLKKDLLVDLKPSELEKVFYVEEDEMLHKTNSDETLNKRINKVFKKSKYVENNFVLPFSFVEEVYIKTKNKKIKVNTIDDAFSFLKINNDLGVYEFSKQMQNYEAYGKLLEKDVKISIGDLWFCYKENTEVIKLTEKVRYDKHPYFTELVKAMKLTEFLLDFNATSGYEGYFWEGISKKSLLFKEELPFEEIEVYESAENKIYAEKVISTFDKIILEFLFEDSAYVRNNLDLIKHLDYNFFGVLRRAKKTLQK